MICRSTFIVKQVIFLQFYLLVGRYLGNYYEILILDYTCHILHDNYCNRIEFKKTIFICQLNCISYGHCLSLYRKDIIIIINIDICLFL